MKYDVLFAVDATASMTHYLNAVREALPQFMEISRLTGIIDEFSVLNYRDMCDIHNYIPHKLTEFSGWVKDTTLITPFVKAMYAAGGGDLPEAAKTAATRVIHSVNKPTIVIWYTDAPPHHAFSGSDPNNLGAERAALAEDFDWIKLCRDLRSKNCMVFPVISTPTPRIASFWSLMAQMTGGKTLHVIDLNPEAIAQTTIGLFLCVVNQSFKFGAGVSVLQHSQVIDETQIQDEMNAGGFLNTGTSTPDIEALEASDILIPKIEAGLQQLPKRFVQDAEYRELVYDVFETILQPGHIMSLTWNTLFGTLWRSICKRRQDERRERLMSQLSSTLAKLPSHQQAALKAWIEMTYDNSEEIEEILEACPRKVPALVLDQELNMTRAELLEVSRSCGAPILHRLGDILAKVRVVTGLPVNKQYIPLDLRAQDMFGLLPHLVVEGTSFSLRPALILAMLAVYTNNALLVDKARSFLESKRGTWLSDHISENYSFDFVKLALKVPEALTASELDLYRDLYKIRGIQINGLTDISLEVGYSSEKTVRPDFKRSCRSCKEQRSFTLLDATGECGLCLSDLTARDHGQSKSAWCQCSSCVAHYVVARPELLNVRAKCHYCREEHERPPTVSCASCMNHFVCASPESESWICPPCADSGKAVTEIITASLKDILRENGAQLVGLDVQSVNDFFAMRSLYQVRHTKIVAPQKDITIVCDKRIVLNQTDAFEQIEKWIAQGSAEQGTCMLCYEDMRKDNLMLVCGRRGCESRACTSCLDAWYGQLVAGKIIIPANLICPFCKKMPSSKVLRRHNPQLSTLKPFDVNSLDNVWYHAWCVTCFSVKPCVQKVCSEGMPDVNAWECDDCKETTVQQLAEKPDVVAKECPSCGVMTQKTSGCHHITCTVCSPTTHWCWSCCKICSYNSIYRHLSQEHGGYGFDDYAGGDDDEGYDSDY